MTIIENEEAYDRAVKRNIIENARKTWRANTERAREIEDAISAGRDVNDLGRTVYSENFIGSIAKAFDTYGKLTPNQCAAVLRGIDARAARRAEWADKQAALNATRQHLGEVGQKITLELTIKKIVEIEGAAFSYYDSGLTFIFIMEDADQNVAIYKGNSAALLCHNEGDTVKIKATVKEHGVRNGVKQTVLQRPTVAK